MKRLLAFAFLALALPAASALAQSPAASVLGTRHVQIIYLTQDMRGVSENLNTATARFNFPVFAHIDLGADFDHGWIGGPFSGHVNEFSGTATVFGHFVAVSPFAKARFGTIRSNSAFGKEDHRIWRVTGGVEIPFSRLTITPMAIYDDDDQDAPNSIKEWTYEALLHYWFTPKIGGFASLGKTDFKNSDIDPKNYKAGLTFRF